MKGRWAPRLCSFGVWPFFTFTFSWYATITDVVTQAVSATAELLVVVIFVVFLDVAVAVMSQQCHHTNCHNI